jgi:hypothetical protein
MIGHLDGGIERDGLVFGSVDRAQRLLHTTGERKERKD